MPYKETHVKTMPYDVVISGPKTMKGMQTKDLSQSSTTSNNKSLNSVFKSGIQQKQKAMDPAELNTYFSQQNSAQRQEYLNQFLHLTSTPSKMAIAQQKKLQTIQKEPGQADYRQLHQTASN